MSNPVFETFVKNDADNWDNEYSLVQVFRHLNDLFLFLSVLIQSSLQFWWNTSDLVMELANPKMDKGRPCPEF